MPTCHRNPPTVPRSTLDSMERQEVSANLLEDGRNSAVNRAMIPELLQHIISHIDPPPDRQQYKKFLLVSRLFFSCIAPFLWKNVPNLETLFALIPRLTIKKEVVGQRKGAETIVRNVRAPVSNSPSLNNAVLKTFRFPTLAIFTRFELYAGYIQSLALDAVSYNIQNQHVLEAYCNAKDNILLPNLAFISYIHNPTLSWSCNPLLTWLGWTLTPTLSGFRVNPSPLWSYLTSGRSRDAEFETIIQLQEILVHRCANVRNLDIHLRDFDISLGNKPLLHSSLSPLRNLCTISGSQYLVEPQNLKVLSTIPSLESLKVQSTGGDLEPIDATRISWPANPFPSISSLCLSNLAPTAVQSLLTISSLVAPLRSIQVVLSRNSVANGEWSRNFIRNLPTRMPHISELILTTSNIPKNRSELSQIELNALAQLPLRHVDLFGIGFSYNVTSQDIVLALPKVRILRLSSMMFTIKDLQLYANYLSHLEILACFAVPLDTTTNKHVPVEHEVVIEIYDVTDITQGQLPLYARSIGELWRHVSCTRVGHSLLSEAEELSMFDPLNDAIAAYQSQREETHGVS